MRESAEEYIQRILTYHPTETEATTKAEPEPTNPFDTMLKAAEQPAPSTTTIDDYNKSILKDLKQR
jgi:hypothetical protein